MSLLTVATETANMGFLEEFRSIVTDPAHILAEGVWELVTGFLLYPVVVKVWHYAILKHDKEHHHETRI